MRLAVDAMGGDEGVRVMIDGAAEARRRHDRFKFLVVGDETRIKKALAKWRGKFLDDSTRIVILGCTSEPAEGSKADLKKNFDKAIYFPFPDYSTRRLLWKTFIE